MALSLSIGGAIATFEAALGRELAGALDRTFGAGEEWEKGEARDFGELHAESLICFRKRAMETLGAGESANLLAITDDGRGVFLPAHVGTMALRGTWGTLRCASLPGLRRELAVLAERWGLPEDEAELRSLGVSIREEGSGATGPECEFLARLMVAANEAVRRDCPLWLVGSL